MAREHLPDTAFRPVSFDVRVKFHDLQTYGQNFTYTRTVCSANRQTMRLLPARGPAAVATFGVAEAAVPLIIEGAGKLMDSLIMDLQQYLVSDGG